MSLSAAPVARRGGPRVTAARSRTPAQRSRCARAVARGGPSLPARSKQVRYLVQREFADARRSLPIGDRQFRVALAQLAASLGIAPAQRGPATGIDDPPAAAAAAHASCAPATLGQLLAAARGRALRFDFPPRGGSCAAQCPPPPAPTLTATRAAVARAGSAARFKHTTMMAYLHHLSILLLAAPGFVRTSLHTRPAAADTGCENSDSYLAVAANAAAVIGAMLWQASSYIYCRTLPNALRASFGRIVEAVGADADARAAAGAPDAWLWSEFRPDGGPPPPPPGEGGTGGDAGSGDAGSYAATPGTATPRRAGRRGSDEFSAGASTRADPTSGALSRGDSYLLAMLALEHRLIVATLATQAPFASPRAGPAALRAAVCSRAAQMDPHDVHVLFAEPFLGALEGTCVAVILRVRAAAFDSYIHSFARSFIH